MEGYLQDRGGYSVRRRDNIIVEWRISSKKEGYHQYSRGYLVQRKRYLQYGGGYVCYPRPLYKYEALTKKGGPYKISFAAKIERTS